MANDQCPECAKLRARVARWQAIAQQLIATLKHAATQVDRYVDGTARSLEINLANDRTQSDGL